MTLKTSGRSPTSNQKNRYGGCWHPQGYGAYQSGFLFDELVRLIVGRGSHPKYRTNKLYQLTRPKGSRNIVREGCGEPVQPLVPAR